MRRLLSIVLASFVLIIIGYVVFALRYNDSTNALVKLLGPGANPSVCFARTQPHFKKMRPALTEIADELIASDELHGVGFGYDSEKNFFLHIETANSRNEPSSGEIDFFKPRFESLNNYFQPYLLKQKSDYVIAFSNASCGYSVLDWVAIRLGIDGTHNINDTHVENNITALVALVYRPDGNVNIEKCVEPIKNPDPMIKCEFALNENWVWSSEWWNPIPITETIDVD